MASAKKGKHAPDRVQLSYQLMRNITSPDEKSVDVQTYIANLPAREILKLGTKDNLRGYLPEYDPRKRNRVHDAIRETIDTVPARFIVRNSGFVITASGIEVDDSRKVLVLDDPSIINGAQSQGEIRAYFAELDDIETEDGAANDKDESNGEFYVRATVVVDPDPDEVVETAIARNIVTPVRNISEAGARNQLDELERSIAAEIPGAKIRKNESHTGEGFIDTRLILQLARLLMPPSISGNPSAAERMRAYKNPEQCLTDFCEWERSRSTNPASAARYDFTIQVAPYAWREFQRWSAHPAWNGHQIWSATKKGGRAVKRDRKTGKITWVSPAIIFPLMGALSEFAVCRRSEWRIEKPPHFKEEELVRRAVNQFRAHQSNPVLMGRSEAAYDALRIYPQTLVEVLRDVEASA